jgi:hypothetical protein
MPGVVLSLTPPPISHVLRRQPGLTHSVGALHTLQPMWGVRKLGLPRFLMTERGNDSYIPLPDRNPALLGWSA